MKLKWWERKKRGVFRRCETPVTPQVPVTPQEAEDEKAAVTLEEQVCVVLYEGRHSLSNPVCARITDEIIALVREHIATDLDYLAGNCDPDNKERSLIQSETCEWLADRVRHPERYSGVAQQEVSR